MVSFSAARCWVKRTGGRETSGTRTANLIALVAADRRRILERRRLGVSSSGGRWRREVQERRARDRTPPNGRWHSRAGSSRRRVLEYAGYSAECAVRYMRDSRRAAHARPAHRESLGVAAARHQEGEGKRAM